MLPKMLVLDLPLVAWFMKTQDPQGNPALSNPDLLIRNVLWIADINPCLSELIGITLGNLHSSCKFKWPEAQTPLGGHLWGGG